MTALDKKINQLAARHRWNVTPVHDRFINRCRSLGLTTDENKKYGFMLPFSMLAICFVETWQRSASCSCVKPASLRSLRTFSPSTFKSEFGIIVHLNSIVSFW